MVAGGGGQHVDVEVGEEDEVEVEHGPYGPLEQHGVLEEELGFWGPGLG